MTLRFSAAVRTISSPGAALAFLPFLALTRVTLSPSIFLIMALNSSPMATPSVTSSIVPAASIRRMANSRASTNVPLHGPAPARASEWFLDWLGMRPSNAGALIPLTTQTQAGPQGIGLSEIFNPALPARLRRDIHEAKTYNKPQVVPRLLRVSFSY